MSSVTFDNAVANALRREVEVRRRRHFKLAAWSALAVVALWYSAVQIKLSPVALVRGAGYMWDFITRLFPPDLSYLAILGGATIETVQIAKQPRDEIPHEAGAANQRDQIGRAHV